MWLKRKRHDTTPRVLSLKEREREQERDVHEIARAVIANSRGSPGNSRDATCSTTSRVARDCSRELSAAAGLPRNE